MLVPDHVAVPGHDQRRHLYASQVSQWYVWLIPQQVEKLQLQLQRLRVVAVREFRSDTVTHAYDAIYRPWVGGIRLEIRTHPAQHAPLIGVVDGEQQADDAAITPAQYLDMIEL